MGKFCNRDKKVVANTAVMEVEQPAMAPAAEVTENGAIELCFFGVEITNRFAVLYFLELRSGSYGKNMTPWVSFE